MPFCNDVESSHVPDIEVQSTVKHELLYAHHHNRSPGVYMLFLHYKLSLASNSFAFGHLLVALITLRMRCCSLDMHSKIMTSLARLW